MKKLTLAICFLVTLVAVKAQRVDLDKFKFTTAYRNFPSDPLPQEYKTYHVRIEAAPSVEAGINMNNLVNAVDITGLKKVTGTGHVTILAIMDDIIFEKSETKERIEVKKDKQGNETRKPYYSVELTYSFSARASVYDYKGKTILSNFILYSRDEKSTYKTGESSSATEAVNGYNNKLLETKSSLAQQLANAALNNLNNSLNNLYGYREQRANDILWILNNKRHAEYDGHQKAWNNFRNAIVLMSADEPLNKVKEKMQPVIDYFEKAKDRYSGTGKEDKKLRYASYYNLAKIYYYLDQPDKAIREADALAMNDYDAGDAKFLRGMAESLENLFRKNNMRTRHFAMDIANYEPPVKY
ncbi:MAG: tetratricopeptide repeat protein [Chitinophagaceae bacterium]|nr:tetratricopeptide repeat protein [Chitinophagaceae bacterium]